jgi:hypothetical protein
MALMLDKRLDCATAWLDAATAVDNLPGHTGHTIVIEIDNPTAGASLSHPIVSKVDAFLRARCKSVDTIANTIFPAALYRRYGYPDFISRFRTNVLPKVRRTDRWSGYYFDRMTGIPRPGDEPFNQLADVIRRMGDAGNPCLNKFEIVIFDPLRDVDESPYGGQCLSLLSFKLLPGTPKKISLTAVYRNHFYIEKLLGNIIGLSRLLSCVAAETGHEVGPLIIHSTHAVIDTPGKSPLNRRSCVTELLEQCRQAATELAEAA